MRLLAIALALTLLGLLPAPPARGAAGPIDVTRATLPNGLQVVVLRDPLAPVVSTMMNYLVGADDEPITGLAHAQEHMLFRGSRSLSASQLSEVASITGGSFNADTQNEVTQFFFTMPAQDLDIALHLEASRAQGVLDSQQLWNEERGAIMQEVSRDNSDASYRLYVKILHHLLAGTPYADEGLGTLQSFGKQIQAPQLQRFYATWYHPNNALLVVAGDVDPQATIAKVRVLFGGLPAQKLPARRHGTLAALTPATFTDRSDQPYTEALLGYRFPGYNDPDYAASQVLVDVLNSQRGSLYDLVASGKAFAVSAQSQTYPGAGLALLDAQVAPDVTPQQALASLRDVVDADRKDGVPDELVQVAKAREAAQSAFARSSISGLAQTWSEALAVEHRTPDDDLAAIGRVTTADVNRVLREYLDNATATSAYAVPASAGAGGSEPQGRAGENNTVVPTGHVALPSWAKGVLANLHAPARTTQPTAFTLANGITLIVQPESVTHTVSLRGTIRTSPGLQEAPGTEGVSSLTEALLPFGTTSLDRLGFQRALDAIAANVGTGTSFSLDVANENFDRGVQLLADDELHPAFAADSFEIEKRQELAQVQSQQQSPEYRAQIALARALYPAGDPARRFATPTSVGSLTLDGVKHWYATAYRPDVTTIVVVGDVTPARAREVVEHWFGDWHADGPKPRVDPPQVPNNPPARVQVPATGRIQASVTMAETLGLHRSDPDYARLRVANAILSGGFSSILFNDLRERTGYVYTVDSGFSVGKTRSTFKIEFGSAPLNVPKAEALIATDVRAMQTTLQPVERLQVAKAMLLGQVTIGAESYDGIAGRLLAYASNALPLDQDLIDARNALATTPQQLRTAMSHWVRPRGFVEVIQGPARTSAR